ncbi:MAG: efflux RND transporter periplasmic adaptor subunit [Cyclobacteriaceae bacterium]|nr:efflux RND transporter periplasmic adaptor subunit [Cyclobacteriaceae bacterium]
MHPTVVSDRQGVCPVCNMDLVRKARAGEEVKITEELARLIKSPNESVVSDIKTVKGEYTSQPVTGTATGVVTYDTRNLFTIPARVGGRLEKVFLKYAFQPVRKGQKVAEIYSADLAIAQRELLFLISQQESAALIEDAKQKLRLVGVTDAQIKELIQSKEIQYRFPVLSAVEGYVILKEAQPPVVQVPVAMGMAASVTGSSQSPVESTALVREGEYVNAGATLFNIVSTYALWIEISVPSDQSRNLNVGDTLNLVLNNQQTKQGRVGFVQPFFNDKQGFAIVRVYVPDANLKPGAIVTAQWTVQSDKLMWVPREAVIDLGNESVVFVKERGAFVPKQIAVIESIANRLALSGISSSDELAADAQFMVDSEGFIRTKK